MNRFRIVKRGRYFAVMEAETLVCICVYKRGALEVIRRLSTSIPQPN